MRIKKIVTVISLSAGMLALAACSTVSKNGHGAPVSDVGGNGNATAMGYGAGSGFNGVDGIPANCHQAPVNQSYYFELNKQDVHQNVYPCIAAQAKYLSVHPNAQVKLNGNTDERGSLEYNMGLGWRRADAVKTILMQDGAAAHQIQTKSWGPLKPVATGHDEAAWQQNRRTDLVYKSR